MMRYRTTILLAVALAAGCDATAPDSESESFDATGTWRQTIAIRGGHPAADATADSITYTLRIEDREGFIHGDWEIAGDTAMPHDPWRAVVTGTHYDGAMIVEYFTPVAGQCNLSGRVDTKVYVARRWCEATGTDADSLRLVLVELGTPGVARYPVNIVYRDNLPDWLRSEIEWAAREWGRVLAPTPRSVFVIEDTAQANASLGLEFNPGDTLPAGITVYVMGRLPNGCPADAGGCAGPAWSHTFGSSEAGTEAVGFMWLNVPRLDSLKQDFDELPIHFWEPHVSYLIIHELGHIFGIGTSPRWYSNLSADDRYDGESWRYRFHDSLAIRAFDSMDDEGAYPAPQSKVPTVGSGHWDGCPGHADIMTTGSYERGSITVLTLASLSDGFVPLMDAPPIMARLPEADIVGRRNRASYFKSGRVGRLDPSYWNDGSLCVDGLRRSWWGGQAADRSDVPVNDAVVPSHHLRE